MSIHSQNEISGYRPYNEQPSSKKPVTFETRLSGPSSERSVSDLALIIGTVVKRSRAELIDYLRVQLGHLRTSAAAFDGGNEDEAQRLATTIRVLVHDTSHSTGLLKQLKVKHGLRFLDTAHRPPPPGVIRLYFGGLAVLEQSDESGHYRPRFADKPPQGLGPQPFRNWWNRQVLQDLSAEWFTRREIVLFMANQDGGTHVDPEIEPRLHALTRLNSMGLSWRREGDWSVVAVAVEPRGEPLGSPLPANVRQIAYELEETITGQLGGLLPPR
jgi:hypothetical protein